MIEFIKTPKNEQEIIINADIGGRTLSVYSSCRATCYRLLRALTVEPESHICKGKISGMTFKISFDDRVNMRKVIKMNLLLGKIS